MSATALALAALAAYVLAEIAAVIHLRSDRRALAVVTVVFLIAGLAVHFAALLSRARMLHSVPYRDLPDSMSLFAWMLTIAYLVLYTRHRESAAGPFLIPVVMLFLAISLSVPGRPRAADPKLSGPLFACHVTIAILGYAALTLSFVLALLYLVQSRQIQRRRLGLLFARLPSLEALSRLQDTTMATGVAALTVSMALGLIWAHHAWGTIWDVKFLATLAVIGMYAAALAASRGAWRGRRAAFLSIGGFGFLLFSYTIVNVFLSHSHVFR